MPGIHQAWAAVKTRALGTVGAPVLAQEAWGVHPGARSSCSRRAAAASLGRLALVETHRRGPETAHPVCAVSAGAEGMHGVVDRHRPAAVRMVAFPQALGSVAQAGHARYGAGTPAVTVGCATPRQTLTPGDPAAVVRALRRVGALAPRQGAPTAVATGQERVASVENRRGMST